MKKIIQRFKTIALVNIIIVSVLSVIILIGWLFYSSDIKNLFPDNQLSNPVTCLTFLLSCLSFICIISPEKSLQYTGKALAVIVLLTGIIKFSEVLFNY